MTIIYVDMDGVLVNFNGRIRELFGKDFIDLDNNWVWNVLLKIPNLYRDLNPMDDYLVLWSAIRHLNPKILTAIPSKVEMSIEAMQDKIEWIEKHINKNIEVLFGPYSINKQNYCRYGDVLIDDNYLNINQWNAKGGIGILHTSAINTVNQLRDLKII